jgi:hypothetical protein
MHIVVIMAGIRFQIRHELEEKFREAAMRRFGFAKGALSRAAEEAIEGWLSNIENIKYEGDPVEAIDGLLSDIKMDSVKLQHSARKLWTGVSSGHVSR